MTSKEYIFIIVGSKDQVLFEYDFGSKKVERHLNHFIAHAALDIVDEYSLINNQMYLKPVDKFNEWIVSPFVGASGVRFLILHSRKNDEGIRQFFHEMYETYIKYSMNPFYKTGSKIEGKIFEQKCRMSSSPSFPFDLLHMEMVRYAKEIHEQRSSERNTECIEGLDKQTSQLVQKAMAHHNPETTLERMGYGVGYVLAEKVSKDSPIMSTELEIMKFICKEFWVAAFGKQVDNLRTNHQGVYVVQDSRFCSLASFPEGAQFVQQASIFLSFPCGIVRGALYALGIVCLVTPTTDNLPAVKFHIQIQQKSS